MSELLFETNTAGVGDMNAFEIYPDGEYVAVMTRAIREATKDGQGSFIKCTYQIIDGPYLNKVYISRLNLWNNNATAVEIAKKEVGALRKALGLSDTEADTAKYVNRPLILVLKVKNKKVNGVATAEVEQVLTNIKSVNGGQTQQQTQQQQQWQPQAQQQQAAPVQQWQPQPQAQPQTWGQQPQGQPQGGAKMPWQKR